MSETIKTYKGTDQNMRCHGGYQYELGKTATDTDAIRCGYHGFHSCEAPLDVLQYFPLRDGNRYFEAEAGGKIDRTGADDSKLASSELTLKAEIGIPGLMKAQMAYVKRACDSASEQTASGPSGNAAASGPRGNAAASGPRGNAAASGHSGNAAASGYGGNAAASGYRGNAAASGDWGNAAASGPRGNAAASGYGGNAAASGDGGNAAASGDWGNAAASGPSGNAAASGDWGAAVVTGMYGSADASGKQCIAVAWGRYSKARGALGCWLVLSEHDVEENRIKGAVLVQVDGEAIKPDTWYTLENGEIVEARID